MIDVDPQKTIFEDLDLYAKSFARFRFFKIYFPNDHSTYIAEANLFEINESKLRSSMFMNLRIDSLIECRPIIESEIKKKIQAKLSTISENQKIAEEIMNSIKSSDFDSLFNFSG